MSVKTTSPGSSELRMWEINGGPPWVVATSADEAIRLANARWDYARLPVGSVAIALPPEKPFVMYWDSAEAMPPGLEPDGAARCTCAAIELERYGCECGAAASLEMPVSFWIENEEARDFEPVIVAFQG